MTTENHNVGFIDDSDFDFFDFSDVDPFFVKKNAIANEILALISHENVSRKELSEKLGWAQSRLSKVLSGEQNLTVKTITAISIALDYDFSIYFHKIHKKEMIQPWERYHEISNVYHFKKVEANTNLLITIQNQDEVIKDIIEGKGKDRYVSLSINKKINEKSIKNKDIRALSSMKNTLAIENSSTLHKATKMFDLTSQMFNPAPKTVEFHE